MTKSNITLHLVNSDGRVMSEGCIVHVTSGPNTGRAYRFEGVYIHGDTHHVKVTRKSTHGHFRSVEWLHPSVLGCEVHRKLTRAEAAKLRCHALWARIDDWFWAGTFALIPLAVFEHFHLATKITEIVSLGMITGGGGEVSAGH